MGELTVLMFILALCLFIVSYILKKDRAISWIAFFVSICAIGQIVTDTSLTETETILMIIPVFFALMMSGLNAFFNKVL